MVNKVLFVGFRGGDRPIVPPWIRDCNQLLSVRWWYSCKGAKFSVDISNAQKVFVAHTYKLSHAAFICIKYKM